MGITGFYELLRSNGIRPTQIRIARDKKLLVDTKPYMYQFSTMIKSDLCLPDHAIRLAEFILRKFHGFQNVTFVNDGELPENHLKMPVCRKRKAKRQEIGSKASSRALKLQERHDKFVSDKKLLLCSTVEKMQEEIFQNPNEDKFEKKENVPPEKRDKDIFKNRVEEIEESRLDQTEDISKEKEQKELAPEEKKDFDQTEKEEDIFEKRVEEEEEAFTPEKEQVEEEFEKTQLPILSLLSNVSPEELEDVEKHCRSARGVDTKLSDLVMNLLSEAGFTCIQCQDQEADSKIRQLAPNYDYVISDDSDFLASGVSVVRNFGELLCDFYDTNIILQRLKLTREQMLEMVCLCGCDYFEGLPRMGIKTAYKYILKYKSVENWLKNMTPKDRKKFQIPIDLLTSVRKAVALFKE